MMYIEAGGREPGMERPVGIGPVIAGWVDNQPVYYVDLVFAGGATKRMVFQKRGKGADRPAKNEAYRERINLANALRPQGVVLTHDQDSFQGLVSLLSNSDCLAA